MAIFYAKALFESGITRYYKHDNEEFLRTAMDALKNSESRFKVLDVSLVDAKYVNQYRRANALDLRSK